jgi:membrane peptidoglycan carboxypeptidase
MSERKHAKRRTGAVMKPLFEQEPKLNFIHPREALTKIHMDLFKVHSNVRTGLAFYPPALTNLEKLVLVLEDRRFMAHHGFDVKSMLRELLRAVTFRRHGGASTIDMQFVRTSTGYKERTFGRKLYEIVLAVIIQFRYSKIVILRSYLACAFFGSHLRGANAAARKVFDKTTYDLSEEEAAFIAAMLVHPRPLHPTPEWTSRVQRRADYGKRIYIANKKRFDQLPS